MRGSAILSILLAAALVASCVAAVYGHHVRRTAFVELERLEAERDALQVEWGQLQLERSTWAANDRIERVARERLDLRPPATGAVVLVVP